MEEGMEHCKVVSENAHERHFVEGGLTQPVEDGVELGVLLGGDPRWGGDRSGKGARPEGGDDEAGALWSGVHEKGGH